MPGLQPPGMSAPTLIPPDPMPSVATQESQHLQRQCLLYHPPQQGDQLISLPIRYLPPPQLQQHPALIPDDSAPDPLLRATSPTLHSLLPSDLNGGWRSDEDLPHRRKIMMCIIMILKRKNRNAYYELLPKLPRMLKSVEAYLYSSAPSFEVYADLSTVHKRLRILKFDLTCKAG
mmetsp:Transcript_21067/g.38051  ORF Transcript_21067/g.38051 Transcript_21067/m.38051 type:complete len:175 (-) Transcript_21067:600-1124(-)|eukprot:CAMPEP_0198293402 /NCGR_PEP_ID=MMETSP1449-20131203/17009_1 /TAXON_ID=420275 /ORGANISM="Attheya septentrionalis, Strain CCMP2084" /LENGTH=174 /DNA_ID=CAMNT_0043992961 /DNA_START=282 /DNA_END=806 /DNA_ORIENTATION=-